MNAGPNQEKPQPISRRIILPVFITIALFVGTIFFLIIPLLEMRMMAAKREMIRELTQTAWSTAEACRLEELDGRLSRSQAQAKAASLLRAMRYGPEGKDYFWINDTHPRLIMHPYRPDLEGQDISGITDPAGKHLFVEFVKEVEARGAGYVDYSWQWKDDPNRIVPKISYVKGFSPWGWIIGTGIYVEDVGAEIAAITRKLIKVCLSIFLLILGLSFYIVWQNWASERRRLEATAALRESEERYRLLAETAGEFIIATDAEGTVTYANRAWLEKSGYSADEMSHKRIVDLLAPEDMETFLQKALHGPETTDSTLLLETGFRIRSGAVIPVEVTSARLVTDGGVSKIFFTARDIAERKQAARQAEIHREQLFQADKMATLGTLVSGVAHEINNPVSMIMLNAPVLKKAWDSVLPVLDAYHQKGGDIQVGRMGYSQIRERIPLLLADMEDGARRVKAIVGDLKDFSRQEPGQMSDNVDINAVCGKAVALVANLIQKHTRRFSARYGENLPPLAGNARKLEQVVINLLVNACQSLPDPGRGIELATSLEPGTAQLVVEVSDEGCGMNEEILQRICDPFFTTKRETGGTGLGLAIARRILEDHGGQMHFTSFPGRGTTVRVHLPARQRP